MADSTGARTRIGAPLRIWFAVELFFAVSASISVGLRPEHSATSFAWPIQPPVMASLFGAFYLAVAPVVVLLLFAKRWEHVRVFVIPAMLFTAAQLVVTFLHWERFSVGTMPFNIWFASYLLPPPVFLYCYVAQQRRAAPSVPAEPLPGWLRGLIVVVGAAVTLDALIGLVWPAWITSFAPWRVTPLNARALCGFLLLVGLMLLSIARENDRDRVRIVSPFLVLLLPLAALQLHRFADQVAWSHPRLLAGGVLLALVSALGVLLMRGSWRRTLGG